jgi:hypothetical protein
MSALVFFRSLCGLKNRSHGVKLPDHLFGIVVPGYSNFGDSKELNQSFRGHMEGGWVVEVGPINVVLATCISLDYIS